MGRLRFILLSGLVLAVFVGLSLVTIFIFIDEADFVSQWSPSEQAKRLTEVSLIAAALVAPLVLGLFARRLVALGWSARWSILIYGLIVVSFCIEWTFPNDLRTGWAWLPFGVAFICLIFGDLKFGISQRNADA